jgi:riboflavin kinase
MELLQRGVLHAGLAPQVFKGVVVRGFGRGSKELGCPTANIPITPYEEQLAELPMGVYWGLASVNSGPVYGMALNIGWSPFYGNKEKTIEIHVLAQLDDFYGEHIACMALGFIRPEVRAMFNNRGFEMFSI